MTPELLKEYFAYHPRGWLVRKKSTNRRIIVGSTVRGTPTNRGYLITGIMGRKVLVHRVVFALKRGWLPREVDHINRKRTDNRIGNLRAATSSQNKANSIRAKHGVYFEKRTGKWWGRVAKDGKLYHVKPRKSRRQVLTETYALRRKLFGEFAPKEPTLKGEKRNASYTTL